VADPNPEAKRPIPAEPIDYAAPAQRANPGYIPVKGRMAIGCLGYILLSVLWFVGFHILKGSGPSTACRLGLGLRVGVR